MSADDVVRARLLLLRHEIAYLKQEQANAPSFQAYAENVRLKRAVERGLHLAIAAWLEASGAPQSGD